MKFLICGLGSIGQRHVRMIQEIAGKDANIAAYRSRGLGGVISDTLELTVGIDPQSYYGITTFYEFDDALGWKPDAVFITNPISLHVTTAIAAAKAGCSLFIEKPLGHDESGIAELSRIVAEKQLVCMVGYQLRYHPAYLMIRELIERHEIGRLTSADLHFGEWLPGMHPYEDYRDSHAARRDQGGGVILCLSHEIDIASWLFGKPRRVYAQGGKLSDLEIDVEDTADLLLSCGSEGREFPVHIHLDFLQKPARRYIHVVGEAGSIVFDYFTNELVVRRLPKGERETIAFSQFQRNDMFLQEVSAFIDSIKLGTPSPISLGDGILTLQICLAAKRSLESGNAELVP